MTLLKIYYTSNFNNQWGDFMRTKYNRYNRLISIILMVLCLFIFTNSMTLAADDQTKFDFPSGFNIDTIAGKLMAGYGNPDGVQEGACDRYVNAGVFTNITECNKFKSDNSVYGVYASTNLKQYDTTTGRMNAALESFNEHAHFIYSFMTGFACLTSLLVFVIIFVRITWLPEHAAQRRKAMEDIVTAGVTTILLGGFWLVVGVFQSMFSRFWETYTVYSKDWTTAGNQFLYEYKTLIVGLLGLATLTALLMLIKSITGVVMGGNNPTQKRAKMTQVLYCGLATAGLGGITIFAGLFWNILK